MDAVLQTVLTGAIATVLAFVVGQLADIIKHKRDFEHRWDRDLYDEVNALVATSRRLSHLARSKYAGDDLDTVLEQVRVSVSRISLLADLPLSRAALQVQREAYALIELTKGKDDPRSGSGVPPFSRYLDALDEVRRQLRRQLRVKGESLVVLPD
ncbi:hypothetical protein [Microbacterium sp. JZ37]|uniref:hypothetical protein n=1 Tax=Microbacterium sp. JZ37 TaxID=2654193 RepID=UPI002B45E8E8|nr:hypothetical protein [Microbacterium sp. JZ37]WRH16185.1 hypothetical protein GC092_00720 [Microbacterium sp. JZ37]